MDDDECSHCRTLIIIHHDKSCVGEVGEQI